MSGSLDTKNRIPELAKKVLSLARDSIALRFRFFDKTLSELEMVEDTNISYYCGETGTLTYNPRMLLHDFAEDDGFAVRLLLHVMFHNIFSHYELAKDVKNRQYWDIACDIAVENSILALESGFTRLGDEDEKSVISKLSKWVPQLSAQQLYREFMVGGISSDSAKQYPRIFSMDTHLQKTGKTPEEIMITKDQWEKISRRVAAELKSFSKDVKGKETILFNLREATRKRYDYDDIVRRFATQREEIKVNPDEFDYICYTYGMSMYGNMPLIEPLEYTEEKKIRDFVIAVDTSASVRGKLVESFLERTYDLLTSSSSFSESMNVHVIQCDSTVTEDTVIKDRSQIRKISEELAVKGFGATDFRPVFERVREMTEKKEFTDLKGLIYFTDGYGIYPENPPGYDCMFVFDREDEFRPPVPGWAVNVSFNGEEMP